MRWSICLQTARCCSEHSGIHEPKIDIETGLRMMWRTEGIREQGARTLRNHINEKTDEYARYG